MANEYFPHDSAYKALFRFPAMVESLLNDFLPEEFVEFFDFSTLKPSSASYVRRDFKKLHNDLVWQLEWRGKPSILALILEFQSSDDYWMSARMAAYTGNFWIDYIDAEKLKIGELLPAIFPVVLYNGEKPWNAPISIRDLIDVPYSRFMPTQPTQNYYVIDARRVSRELLDKAEGEAAYVIRAEQATTGEQIAEIGMDFISRNTDSAAEATTNLDRTLFKWLDMRIEKVEPEWRSHAAKEQPKMLAEILEKVQAEFRKCRREGFEEGESKGFAEGEAKAKAEVVSSQRTGLLEMLALRFGEIPADWQNAISKLNDPEKISELTISILKVKSLEEYGKLLMAATNP